MGLSRFCSAMTLLPDFLNPVEHFRLNDRWVGVVEYGSVFFRILPLLLVPDGIGVGLEVDRAASVLLALKDTYDSFRTSMIRICGFRMLAYNLIRCIDVPRLL